MSIRFLRKGARDAVPTRLVSGVAVATNVARGLGAKLMNDGSADVASSWRQFLQRSGHPAVSAVAVSVSVSATAKDNAGVSLAFQLDDVPMRRCVGRLFLVCWRLFTGACTRRCVVRPWRATWLAHIGAVLSLCWLMNSPCVARASVGFAGSGLTSRCRNVWTRSIVAASLQTLAETSQ